MMGTQRFTNYIFRRVRIEMKSIHGEVSKFLQAEQEVMELQRALGKFANVHIDREVIRDDRVNMIVFDFAFNLDDRQRKEMTKIIRERLPFEEKDEGDARISRIVWYGQRIVTEVSGCTAWEDYEPN